jgi:hypothetical protein
MEDGGETPDSPVWWKSIGSITFADRVFWIHPSDPILLLVKK